MELFAGAVEFLARGRVDGSSETVLGVVCDGDRFVEVCGLDDCEDGSEDLFLSEASGGADVGDDGGGDVVAALGVLDGAAAV